jgi:hypothetical protein
MGEGMHEYLLNNTSQFQQATMYKYQHALLYGS